MVNQLFLRAYKLFRAAVTKPSAERQSFIEAAEDRDVAAAAAGMLKEFQREGEPQVDSAIALPEWAFDREGTAVNGWHVDGHLGLGGAGRVYRAWRPAPGGKEEAAIKFLDIAPSQTGRFHQERQLLADLNHQGICKFIDGGTTPGGTPYLIMEYVSGLPISRFCDHNRRTVRERLQLFVKLCSAVEYAHDHGIAHRDLKPQNILVTAAGAVRVMDFGVAKMLDRGREDELSKLVEAPLTKAYAAPEQVGGGVTSFATDVYALGALLYELVTGQLPLSWQALSAGDWRQVIKDRVPLPPSQALLLDDPAAEGGGRPPQTAAHLRRSSPSYLSKVVKGNLDAVILTALHKDPKRRYQRVDRMRLDVEYFLNGLPVSARKSGLRERAWIWSTHHRLAAGGAAGWAVWMFLLLQVAMFRDIEYRAAVQDQRAAATRLRYLLEAGLPRIVGGLPQDAAARDLRVLTAQIHTRLLERVEALPAYSQAGLDGSLATSALECARAWKGLGEVQAALKVTDPVLPRVAQTYQLDRLNRQWQDLYANLLRLRVEIHTILRQYAEASDESRRLAEIETNRY